MVQLRSARKPASPASEFWWVRFAIVDLPHLPTVHKIAIVARAMTPAKQKQMLMDSIHSIQRTASEMLPPAKQKQMLMDSIHSIQRTASESLPTVLMARSRSESSRETFVIRLHAMIDSTPDNVVAWNANGLSFLIKDVQNFQNILVQQFRGSSMSAFIRRLNEYGFRKVRCTKRAASASAGNALHFMHERFQRDAPELLDTIHRRQAYTGNRRNRKYDDGSMCEVTEERVACLEYGIGCVRADMQRVNDMLELAVKQVRSLPRPAQVLPQAKVMAATQAQKHNVGQIACDAPVKCQLSHLATKSNNHEAKRIKSNGINTDLSLSSSITDLVDDLICHMSSSLTMSDLLRESSERLSEERAEQQQEHHHQQRQHEQQDQQQSRQRQKAANLSSDMEAYVHVMVDRATGHQCSNSELSTRICSGISDLSLSSSTTDLVDDLICHMSSSLTMSDLLRESSERLSEVACSS